MIKNFRIVTAEPQIKHGFSKHAVKCPWSRPRRGHSGCWLPWPPQVPTGSVIGCCPLSQEFVSWRQTPSLGSHTLRARAGGGRRWVGAEAALSCEAQEADGGLGPHVHGGPGGHGAPWPQGSLKCPENPTLKRKQGGWGEKGCEKEQKGGLQERKGWGRWEVVVGRENRTQHLRLKSPAYNSITPAGCAEGLEPVGPLTSI